MECVAGLRPCHTLFSRLRLYLSLDRRRLALCRRGHGSLLAAGGGLVQLVTDALVMAIWRRGRSHTVLHHSDRGSQYTSEPFQRLLADHGVTCSRESGGQCLGQCGEGELLLLAQDRAHSREAVPDTSPGEGRCVRLHRMLLQSAAATLHVGLAQSHGVRKTGWFNVRGCCGAPLKSSHLGCL